MKFFSDILKQFSNKPIDWDELEKLLIQSDIGINLTIKIIDNLKAMGRKVSGDDVIEVCRNEIKKIFDKLNDGENIIDNFKPLDNGNPFVILMVGINGTGKTTSSAKLAYLLQKKYKENGGVILAAADTFRAAAVEQLDQWANKLSIPIVKGNYKDDPSSVCYRAYEQALKEKRSHLICDTAGRLHTKDNLMEELKKIHRVIKKRSGGDAPHQTIMVVDATTGTNAVNQTDDFNKKIPLDGVIITKLDGSGKGGSTVAIADKLGIAPKFIGTGESVEDFYTFDKEKFLSELV